MFSSASTQRSRNSTGLGRQRAEPDHVVEVEPLLAELADRDERARQRQRRDDRVDAAAVGQARVDHRRRLVDAPPDLRDDLVDDPAQVRLVVEAHGRLVEAALALDPDVVRAVDHDLGDACRRRASRSSGPWPRMSSAISAASRSRSSRESPVSCVEVRRDVGDARARAARRVDVGVEELRAELADHREVDAVLELGERIASLGSAAAPGRSPRRSWSSIRPASSVEDAGAGAWLAPGVPSARRPA